MIQTEEHKVSCGCNIFWSVEATAVTNTHTLYLLDFSLYNSILGQTFKLNYCHFTQLIYGG